MTLETRSWCVGRYTIELPATFEQQNLRAYVGLPMAFEVKGLGPGTREDLEQHVNARYATLQQGMEVGSKHYRAEGRAPLEDLLLIGRREYDPDLPSFDPGFIEVDAYFRRGEYMFHSTSNTLFETIEEVKEIGKGTGELSLKKLTNHIEPYDGRVIPQGTGLCMDRAFFNAPVLLHDGFSASFHDPSTAGLAFTIDLSHTAASPAEPDFALLYGRSSGGRSVDGLRGDEARAYEQPGGPILYEFAGGEGRKTGQPSRSIRARMVLRTDAEDLPPPQEAEMIWDHALNSLRTR
ncbi:hypothetical protein IV417_16395 [Alphaproteobacteria bacterium KMM 3653]|uniref:Tle cognate immunity protein 4 C-terminal domain-containing protein n=1 Tax=Harenicola maris TaxID=2841044 RepID=A0AAP2CWP7_9RHOB|nr:hypothetical protein [Harenicola maris]